MILLSAANTATPPVTSNNVSVKEGYHNKTATRQEDLKKAEADEKITLASLRKLASALDCELQYTLVPRKSLEEILEDRATLVARERLHPISHSMSLEDQSVEIGRAHV